MKNWYHKFNLDDVTKSSHQKSLKSPVGGILQILKNKTCRGSNFVWKNWYHKLNSDDITKSIKSSHQISPKSPVGGILQILKNKTCRGSNFV